MLAAGASAGAAWGMGTSPLLGEVANGGGPKKCSAFPSNPVAEMVMVCGTEGPRLPMAERGGVHNVDNHTGGGQEGNLLPGCYNLGKGPRFYRENKRIARM